MIGLLAPDVSADSTDGPPLIAFAIIPFTRPPVLERWMSTATAQDRSTWLGQ